MSTRSKTEPDAFIGGEPLTVADLENDARTTKAAEQSILELIDAPAPSYDTHKH